jgi:hypothetical protein
MYGRKVIVALEAAWLKRSTVVFPAMLHATKSPNQAFIRSAQAGMSDAGKWRTFGEAR